MKKIIASYGNDYFNNLKTIRLLFFLIDKCNYQCTYCYNDFPRTNLELKTDDVLRFITYVYQQTHKLIRVEFIGGEVALYNNLYILCLELSKYEYVIDIEIYSNLFKNIEFYNQLVINTKTEINATWHSIPNDTYNYKFLDKILSIPEKLFKHYYITIMFEPNAIIESKYIYETIRKKYPTNKNIEYSLCLNKCSNKSYFYNDYDLQYFYDKCKETSHYRKEFYIEYEDKTYKKITFNDLQGVQINSFKYWLCNTGLDFLYVNFKGDVYKCTLDESSKKHALMNISNNIYPKLPTKPYICAYDYCPCNWEIYRKNILKK